MNPGDVLHKTYRIEKDDLGQGSFGKVYLVTHIRLNILRAVKVLHRSASGQDDLKYHQLMERFTLEAQIGARVRSPFVVQVFDLITDEDPHLLVMEYCAGGSLKDLLADLQKKNEKLAFERGIQMGLELAEGLAELHANDVVHRDLKPGNILFDAHGRAKVADLGLAEVPGGPSMRSQLSEVSQQHWHPGTIGYMSPEQETGRGLLRPSSDIYALGLVLFEALGGQNYARQPLGTPLSKFRSNTPAWLDALLIRMLAIDPNDRLATGTEAAAAFRKKDGGSTPKEKGSGGKRPPIAPPAANGSTANGLALSGPFLAPGGDGRLGQDFHAAGLRPVHTVWELAVELLKAPKKAGGWLYTRKLEKCLENVLSPGAFAWLVELPEAQPENDQGERLLLEGLVVGLLEEQRQAPARPWNRAITAPCWIAPGGCGRSSRMTQKCRSCTNWPCSRP